MFKKIFIASDHTGKNLTQLLTYFLQVKGFEVCEIKFNEKMDYTDIAKEVSSQVLNSTASLGVLICGSGVGVSIVANKFKGIRAALCHSVQISELSRKHNNANVLCLGARIVEPDEQIKILEAFLKTEFEGGRHAARLQKIEI
jgi:ribose 5-phosphate isomerase B